MTLDNFSFVCQMWMVTKHTHLTIHWWNQCHYNTVKVFLPIRWNLWLLLTVSFTRSLLEQQYTYAMGQKTKDGSSGNTTGLGTGVGNGANGDSMDEYSLVTSSN